MGLAVLLCLLAFSVPAAAQVTPCKLSREQAPSLRGFQLGLSEAQVKDKILVLFWGKPDEVGVQEESISPFQLKDKEAAQGLRELKLEFLDGRLSYIEVSYDNSVKWNSADEFKSRIAESLNLPTSGWEDLGEKSDAATGAKASAKKLTCAGFTLGVIVTNMTGPVLMVGEMGLRAEKDKRKEALKNQKQKAFKP